MIPKQIIRFILDHLSYFSYFFLHQQIFPMDDFCTKTKLSNIFKTTNSMTLTKTILENEYKFHEKRTTLKGPVQSLEVVQFWVTSKV